MELAVLIGGRIAGRLDLSDSRSPVFAYDPAYGGYGGPPLSVRFPISGGGAEGDELRCWLEGLLPDHDDFLRALRAEHDLARADTLLLLGTPMGADCAGAVQFCPPDQAEALAAAIAALPPGMGASQEIASLGAAMTSRSQKCRATAEDAAANGPAPSGSAGWARPLPAKPSPRCGHKWSAYRQTVHPPAASGKRSPLLNSI